MYPRCPFSVADYPEAQKYCMQFAGYGCRCPCRHCMQPVGKLGALDAKSYPRRDPELMRKVGTGELPRNKKELAFLSLHLGYNELWDIPGWCVYDNPPCRMHDTDHGIVPKLLAICVDWATSKGRVS